MPSPALPPELVARRRRARIVYAAVVVAGLLVVGLTMGLVIGTGESANATLRTSSSAAPLPGGTVRDAPTVLWRTDDHAAEGNPLSTGTVITWSEHRLAGRDAVSGEVRWSYTRDDVGICDAAQRDGRAYVLFRLDGDCNELTTFDANTGKRSWFRTLADVGEGRLQFGAAGLVVSYPTSFHAIDTGSGYDRYPTTPTTGSDCVFTRVVAGATGILTSERCADGDHLALWPNLGKDGQGPRIWRVDLVAGAEAVAATTTVAFAYEPTTGALTTVAVANGASLGAIDLQPATTGPAGPTAAPGSDVVLDLGDRAYDVSEQGSQQWSVASVGPPTVADALGSQVLVPTATGAVRVDVATGDTLSTHTLPGDVLGGDADGGPRVYSAGAGLLVVGDGVAYLR